MKFDGTFELDDVTSEEVWLALSDPYMIKTALPGCVFLVEVDGDPDWEALKEAAEGSEDPPILPDATPEEVADRAFVEGSRHATLIQLSVGGVKPSFETEVTIAEREFPRMGAEGKGSASGSTFEMSAWMELTETDDGVEVVWEAEADVFGRIAQFGSRVINPVANRVVNQFFDNVADRIQDASEGEDTDEAGGLRDRVRGLF